MLGQRFFSLLILAILGLNLLGDLNSSAQSHSKFSIKLLSAITNDPTQSTHVDESPLCADACHTSSCHFGHCSHLRTNSLASFFAMLEKYKFSDRIGIYTPPFLEKPKLPPISIS